MNVLDIAAITLTGLMVGNELAIAAFIHPVLTRLPDAAHFAAARPLARLLGAVMPFWYALVLLLNAAVAVAGYRQTHHLQPLVVTAATLILLAIIGTLIGLLPVNTRIAAWTDETTIAQWKQLRTRWDTLHRIRVVLLTVAFVLLTTGILAPPVSL